VFFIAFVNPTFPLQNSSLTDFVSYLGNAIRASTIKFSFARELKIREKAMFTTEQATKAQKGSRGIALLFLKPQC